MRRHVVVPVSDPFGSKEDVTASCTVSIKAAVPATHRGVHVSRIGHVVAEYSARGYQSLSEYADHVARAIAASQYGHARVTVAGRIPHLEPVQADRNGREKLSLEFLHVVARQTIRDSHASADLGLRVSHLVACPCVQNTYRHARALVSCNRGS